MCWKIVLRIFVGMVCIGLEIFICLGLVMCIDSFDIVLVIVVCECVVIVVVCKMVERRI